MEPLVSDDIPPGEESLPGAIITDSAVEEPSRSVALGADGDVDLLRNQDMPIPLPVLRRIEEVADRNLSVLEKLCSIQTIHLSEETCVLGVLPLIRTGDRYVRVLCHDY